MNKTVFHLTHTDARDYYVTEKTNLGFYSTRELALAAMAASELDGLLGPREDTDQYFEIDEYQLEVDGKPVLWAFEEAGDSPGSPATKPAESVR